MPKAYTMTSFCLKSRRCCFPQNSSHFIVSLAFSECIWGSPPTNTHLKSSYFLNGHGARCVLEPHASVPYMDPIMRFAEAIAQPWHLLIKGSLAEKTRKACA
ncbi:Hypothetical predicted protein [Podarcis lilfordi]|uniref:Uncharacterized protein n=1 Tax=Podarcis lilfordi TaxID=74358 RepID=A0AA35KW12_9SAUR|nr:Hypothetical predicted protein [Podarcis lilfordi]